VSIPDLNVPLCPTCGDPVTSGCYPAQGICAVVDDEDDDFAIGRSTLLAPGMSALTDEEFAALNIETEQDARTTGSKLSGGESRD
jgi:hypothetical protein